MDDANWTTALATVVIAVATGVNVWIVKRAANATNQAKSRMEKLIGNIEFLIGSLDSHSTFQLALAAEAASVPVIAWKRSHKQAIPKEQEHVQPFKFDPIYIMVP
jgi:hypothetical protein